MRDIPRPRHLNCDRHICFWAKGHLMANRPTNGGPTSSPPHMHETIETTALAEHDHPAATKSGKVCVACGKDVAGQKRFKDAQGRYWCYDCGVEDHLRK